MSKLVEIKTNTNESIKVASIKADIISKIIEIAPMCDKIDYIYLFGSSLEERCTDRSDIDLAIVSNVTRSRLYSNKSYNNFTSALYNLGTDQDYDILQFNSLSKLQNSKDYVCNEILTKGKVIYTRKETIMEATKNNKDSLIIFEEPIYMKANDVRKIYPHSKYVMTDLVIEEDDANTAGYLVAVSTDRDSFKELVELRHYLAENGLDTALLGFYKNSDLTVYTQVIKEKHSDNSSNNLIIFDEPIYMKTIEVEEQYPNSKYLMKDLVIQDDDADTAGYLMAVSTDESSYDELAELRYKLEEQGLDIAFLGIYGTGFTPNTFIKVVKE